MQSVIVGVIPKERLTGLLRQYFFWYDTKKYLKRGIFAAHKLRSCFMRVKPELISFLKRSMWDRQNAAYVVLLNCFEVLGMGMINANKT